MMASTTARSVSGARRIGGSPRTKTGVTTQGPSRGAALENLDEAVALHRDEIGSEPTEEELRDLGIDPDSNTTGDREPPDVLK